MHRVVVVGGGFGGLRAVQGLRRGSVEVTLIDRQNFHLFQPLTYQVATGALAPTEIAYPLRAIFKRSGNVAVMLAEVHDVDLDAMTMIVRGKGNKQRLVVIGEPAREAIDRYIRNGRSKLLQNASRTAVPPSPVGKGARGLGPPTTDDRPPTTDQTALFLNRNGTRLSQRRIQLIVRKYALAAGLDARIHPHLLRHTFATHLLDGGAELRVVQELMGHSNANTTQIYLHVTEERQRSVVEGSLNELAEVEIARRTLARERKQA